LRMAPPGTVNRLVFSMNDEPVGEMEGRYAPRRDMISLLAI